MMFRSAARRRLIPAAGITAALLVGNSRTRKECRAPQRPVHCAALPSWVPGLGRREPEVGLLTLGLNPSRQTIINLKALDLGQVNRAAAAHPGVGGKGQNAAKAAATFLAGRPDAGVTVAQFLGGHTGVAISRHLDDLKISQITQSTSAATRQTMTLLDYPVDGKPQPTVTELVMPSEELSRAEVDRLLASVLRKCSKQKGILLMGTWPKGVTSDFYAAVARGKGKECLVLMDAFKPIDEVSKILSEGFVDIYKVNAFELCTLMGATGIKEGQVTAAEVVDAVKRAFEKFPGVKYFAITDGASGAYFFSRDGEALRLEIPKVKCLNPIGAGDTVAGVMMATFCAGIAPCLSEAMRLGLAAASAKVQSEAEGGVFEVSEAYRMRDLISVTSLSK